MDRSSSESVSLVESANRISVDLVQQTLAEIFQSAPFRASKQSQQLLRYVVDQTLSGRSELLKERLIGVNVFGRRPDYDTNEDPIVRARAAEVRKRLAQFYLGEGSHSLVRIEIALGSYHASFTELSERVAGASPLPGASPLQGAPQPPVYPASDLSMQPPPAEIEPRKRPVRQTRLAVCLAALTVISLAVGLWFTFRPIDPIDLFWKPLLSAGNPPILYSGSNAVYMLSADFMNRYKATHHLAPMENQGREFAVPITSDMKLGPNDLVAFPNDFITIGDLSANVRLASLFAQHKKRFDLRCGGDVAFGDLRQSPTVLIGAFNNSWTMELTGDLPFTFQHSRQMTIRDEANRSQSWTPTFTSENNVSIDYAVVTRLPHSRTGQALIAIGGMTQAGTRAATDFITDPEQLKKFAATAPRDWASKNLQLVVQTKVVNNIPTSPVVVATRYW